MEIQNLMSFELEKKKNKPGEKLGCRVRLYERDSRIY